MSTAAQVLRQAEALKATVSDNSKNVSEVCVSRQQLEDLYRKVLLMDLEYALDKKVEQELWNHAFKNQINTLQAQAKDKQNPKRTEIQATLNLFLEMASGVYLQLLQLICSTFKLDLPFRRKSSTYGIMKEWSSSKMKINPPKKSSCLYICQYCLVHLGDIARYRQQVDQAQSYYWHAAHLIPVNGQPYNQLAILEVARGNKLSTIFYYIRSLSVRHPFPATATNLEKFFSKISRERTEFRSKLSMTEFVTAFLQFHAFIHLCVELTRAADLSEKLLSSMPAHVTSQSFSWHVLVQMLAINLFAMHHATRQTDGSPDNSPNKKEVLSEDEERSFEIVFNFTVNTLEVLVMYTPKQEQKARGFFTMPAIHVITDWLRLDKDNFSKPVLKQSPVWPHLAKLFNIIQPAYVGNVLDSHGNNKKSDAEIALPEDFELRSFQPIEKAHSGLSFSQSVLEDRSPELMATIRCQRLVNHGKWIAEQFPSLNLLNVKEEKPGRVHFSSATPMVKVVPVSTDLSNTSEKKTTRQNVAIQAIIQKQKGSDTSPERSPANNNNQQSKAIKDDKGDGKAEGHSPTKYLLGTPMKDPQFMKGSGTRSSSTSQQTPATGVSTTRTPTVTFQLPPQQLSPQSPKPTSEKSPVLPPKDSKLYQAHQQKYSEFNRPLGAQYRQMQHQQQLKQQKLQHHHQQIHVLQQPPVKLQQQQQQQQQSNMSGWQGTNQSGPSQGNYPSEAVSGLPQGGQAPNSLTMNQRQMVMQQQFEALQKMGASPQTIPPPRQTQASADNSASHAAMIASQQQLLNAMATLHQQQQQQQQQQNAPGAQPSQMPLLQQQGHPVRQMHPRPPHPQLASTQPPPPQQQQQHLLQSGPVPRQQQPPQPPFPGPLFMHQRFASARQQHPPMQFRGQAPQLPTGRGQAQSSDRQMAAKFSQNEAINPAMFLNSYPGVSPANFPFPFTQPAGPMTNQHPATVGSPHPIGTPPGGSCLQGPREEREMMTGMANISLQPPRNPPRGPSPSRMNNHMDPPAEPLLINKSESPQTTDGSRSVYKGGEGGGDLITSESGQQGTYSLFSSTPWSVQISSSGDSKSLGSSPFSSQASSIRNSPDQMTDMIPGEATLAAGFNLGLGYGTGDNHWGLQGPDHASQVVNSNMHSLWSSPGPSPLQRLLEQQRQHRQNDPH